LIASILPALQRLRTRPALPPALLGSLVPIVLLAVALTAAVMVWGWRDQAGYKPVFGAREKVAAADMMTVLDAEHVPYRIHPETGQVLVPQGQLGKVRMLLAAKGVAAQLPAGLELMDRNDPLGVSQFVQDVRFRRGLEGELAQSIVTLDAVESARVHLSIAKSSSFVATDGEKSSAAVVLTLKPGRTLSREQIAAVVHLVAGSVSSLAPERVSLVDQAGNLLSARVDFSEGFDGGAGPEAAHRYEEEARRNVQGLLAPVLGEDNYKLSVTAAVDNDRVEETREQYGDAPKVTNEATRDEQDRSRLALGVPGSLSNRPVAVAAEAASAGQDDAGNRRNASTRQFAYDRTITQIKRGRGQLHRLSVAVALNAAAAPDRAKGWTPADISSIERLLRSGLGLDAARGDELVVSALAFPKKPAPQQWWEDRDTQIDIGTNVVWAIGALLGFFFVVRPAMTMLGRLVAGASQGVRPATAAPADAAALAAPVAAAASAALPAPAHATSAGGAAMPVVPLLENYDLPPAGSPVDVMVDHLKALAAKEPERVAEVVKQWVQRKHGRNE
jgi:flagellar M-ring protein FliF